jgi:2-succinyl-5-enolpyruvyl-6-hydroxy-3-cyclohexene-1-carboxylate synthase
VSPFPFLQDPERNLTLRVQSDIEPFCDTFEAGTDSSWLTQWQQIDHEIHTLHEELFASLPTESHAIRSLPTSRPIFFGNSMPIRNADHFFFPDLAPLIFANRGVAGIDGNIATIAGIAEALKTPILGFIGDQTALHDLNSLPLIKNHKILLIISNNFGGGIFDFLPVSKSPHLDKLFAASHSWNFKEAAKMFDIPYVRMEKSLKNLPDVGIVELMTDRKENHDFKEHIQSSVMKYLQRKVPLSTS